MIDKNSRIDMLLHRQDISDCLARFSRGIDRFDKDLFLSAFHKDAEISAGPFVGGPADLYEWAAQMHEQGQVATQHNLLNHSCDLDGDTAHTETYYLFVGRNRDDSNWMAGGRYIDRLECRDGEWKISLRTNVIEWSGLVPTTPIPFTDVADINANGASLRSKDDMSYVRPLVNKRQKNIPTD